MVAVGCSADNITACAFSYADCLKKESAKCPCLDEFWDCATAAFPSCAADDVFATSCAHDAQSLRCDSPPCSAIAAREETGTGWIAALSIFCVSLAALAIAVAVIVRFRSRARIAASQPVFGTTAVRAAQLPIAPPPLPIKQAGDGSIQKAPIGDAVTRNDVLANAAVREGEDVKAKPIDVIVDTGDVDNELVPASPGVVAWIRSRRRTRGQPARDDDNSSEDDLHPNKQQSVASIRVVEAEADRLEAEMREMQRQILALFESEKPRLALDLAVGERNARWLEQRELEAAGLSETATWIRAPQSRSPSRAAFRGDDASSPSPW